MCFPILLWREHHAKIFNSRLKLRLMLMFVLIAVLPDMLVKGVFLIKQNPSSQVQILRFPDNSTFSTALNRLHPAYPSDPRTSSPKGQGVKTS